MNARNFSFVLAIIAFSSGSVFAQNFFWSDFGFGDGAVNDDLTTTVETGSSTELFLYYQADGQDIGIGIDMRFGWSQDGIVGFSNAETFDFDVTIPSIPITLGPRWGDFTGPDPDLSVDDARFLAANVTGQEGIGAANDGSGALLDEGFDTSAGAFLIGSISFDALAAGKTELDLEFALIVDGGVAIPAVVSGATITVGIPEPASTGLLVFCLVGLAARRRR